MALIDNLISYYKLDNGALTTDSHGSNTLTNTNTVTNAAGKINDGGSFASASSQKLDVADNAGLSPTAAFTVQAWVYQPTAVGAGRTLVSKGTYSGSWTFQIGADATGTGDEIEVFISTGAGDVGNTFAVTTDANMAADTWYHVLVVYDGSLSAANRLKVYVNGVSKTLSITGTIPAAAFDSSGPFTIGAWNGLGRYMNGRIDEVGFWSDAKTSSDATALYNGGAGFAYPFTDPVASMSGTFAGAATASGALVASAALAGAFAGAATTTAALVADATLSGSYTGAATATGTLGGDAALSGSTAGVAAFTATASLVVAMAGTFAGIAAFVGTMTTSAAAALESRLFPGKSVRLFPGGGVRLAKHR